MTEMKSVFSEENAANAIERLRSFHRAGKLRSCESRLEQLRALKRFLSERREDLILALKSDLNKSRSETLLFEIDVSVNEIDHALDNLRSWMEPESVPSPAIALPATSTIHSQSLGLLLVVPLIAAISAGNTVVIKTSELTPATSNVFAKHLNDFMHKSAVAVVEGAVDAAQYLLSQRFDHILFTGSTRVGRIVMKAASANLTPVTLELGGKCPVVVLPSADVKISAKRVIWSKWLNAGQTCIAADYVLVHSSVKDEFIKHCGEAIQEFLEGDARKSEQYCRIISEGHTRRLKNVLADAVAKGATIEHGGSVVLKEKFVEPTVLSNVELDNPIMEEEIFGPLLPVIGIDSIDEAIDYINSREKPLALYPFTSKSSDRQRFINETTSGAICFNDITFHKSNMELPFGGVGNSGMGAYGGKTGFDTFSHKRSVMKRSFHLDVPQRYPPTSEGETKFLRFVLGIRRIDSSTLVTLGYTIALALLFSFAFKYFSPHF